MRSRLGASSERRSTLPNPAICLNSHSARPVCSLAQVDPKGRIKVEFLSLEALVMKKFWMKGATLALTGTVLSLGMGGGCLSTIIQRILVAVNFD